LSVVQLKKERRGEKEAKARGYYLYYDAPVGASPGAGDLEKKRKKGEGEGRKPGSDRF